jgi:ribose 5-phosphate isomerase B
MKIALGSDHRGIETAHTLVEHLRSGGHEPFILGETSGKACDYPDGAYLVAQAVRNRDADVGILICGSGIGMTMAANKVHGIRAAAVYDEFLAEMSRRHNNANVLCMSGDLCTAAQICAITDAFLAAQFEGGRHERRIRKLDLIERGEDPTAVQAGSESAPT